MGNRKQFRVPMNLRFLLIVDERLTELGTNFLSVLMEISAKPKIDCVKFVIWVLMSFILRRFIPLGSPIERVLQGVRGQLATMRGGTRRWIRRLDHWPILITLLKQPQAMVLRLQWISPFNSHRIIHGLKSIRRGSCAMRMASFDRPQTLRMFTRILFGLTLMDLNGVKSGMRYETWLCFGLSAVSKSSAWTIRTQNHFHFGSG